MGQWRETQTKKPKMVRYYDVEVAEIVWSILEPAKGERTDLARIYAAYCSGCERAGRQALPAPISFHRRWPRCVSPAASRPNRMVV